MLYILSFLFIFCLFVVKFVDCLCCWFLLCFPICFCFGVVVFGYLLLWCLIGGFCVAGLGLLIVVFVMFVYLIVFVCFV